MSEEFQEFCKNNNGENCDEFDVDDMSALELISCL